MAHGYLTPEAANNKDLSLFKTIGDLLKAFGDRGKKNGTPPETGGALAIVKKGQNTDIYKEPDVQEVKVQEEISKGGSLAKRGSSAIKNAMGGALSNMVQRGGPALPPGGPRIPGAKGGSTVDMGGSITKGLNTNNFFSKAVTDGIDADTGEYLSKEARIAAFKAGRPEKTPEVGLDFSGGGNGGDIVSALNANTAAIVRMENAIREQTANDTQLANAEIQASEAMFTRQLAAAKEAKMEKGADLSSAITPDAAGGKGGGGGGIMGMLGGLLGGGRGLLGGLKGLKGLKGLGGALKGLKGIGGKLLGKGAAKGATKGLLKGGLKMGIKKIPIAGLLAGGLFAAQRAMAGDWAGAGMELASGGASMIPGFGTAASLGIDAALMARDATSMPSMSGGGLTSGPKTGYLSMMHGTELTLSGSKSKETLKIGEMLGEGMIKSQRKGKKVLAEVSGFFWENMGYKVLFGAFKKVIDGLWKALKGIFPNLPSPGDVWKGVTSMFTGGGGGGNGADNPPELKGAAKTNTAKATPGALKGTYDSFLGGRPAFTSGFGARDTGLAGASTDHKGIDIGVDPNAEVKAIESGVVEDIYPNFGGHGDGVVIKHADGTKNVYGHVRPNVKIGDEVKAGDKIATIEYWPHPRYPLGRQHLHLERIEGGTKVDPQSYLNKLKAADSDKVKSDMDKLKKGEDQGDANGVGSSTSLLGNNNYGLTTGKSLDVGVKGKNYTFTKTDSGWDVTTGGFMGMGKEKVDPTKVTGLVEAFQSRYRHRLQTDGLEPANKDQAAAVSGASSEVASRDRALNGKATTVVIPEVASAANGGSSGVPVTESAAAGSEGQGLQAFATASIMLTS